VAAEVKIVDAHHHFWDPTRNPYPWLSGPPRPAFRYGDYAAIRRPYGPEDYARDVTGWTVEASVHVEAEWDVDDEVGETRWLAGIRAACGRPTVAVAHARLERDGVEDVLAQHAAFGFVRGIRQKPESGQMSDARWRRGYARLAEHGLSYDLQAPFELLPEAAHLARDYPGTTLIVNHTGLPVDRSEAGLKAWRQALATVAAWPNVALKISGLGTHDTTWPHESNRRVVREAIEIFGAARCMFASNYPVDSLCAPFAAIYRAFVEFVGHLPDREQRALLGDNARSVYRLSAPSTPSRAGPDTGASRSSGGRCRPVA
jgi:predicted TIM-barrel fold metal-dependent hydrolase